MGAVLSRRASGQDLAPRFRAKTLTGESIDNQALKGKVVLVEFWATWCPYCRRDESAIDDLAKEFDKDGLVILAVNFAESKKVVKAWADRSPHRAKVILMEDTNLAAVFDAKAFPQYELIDREGRVAGEQKGSGGDRSLRRLLRKAGLGVEAEGDEAPLELQFSPRRLN
jgi:thiol-disulfide isomerase/thioredoxin